MESLGADNPFHVLELSADASAGEIERQKQKLLGMLELGLVSATVHQSPTGQRERTAESVRRAAAALEDPQERKVWELWAQVPGLHYHMLRTALANQPISTDEFEALGEVWDQVFESDDDDDLPFARFREQIEADLLAVIERAPAFDLDELESDTAREVAAQYGQQAAERLEISAERFCRTMQGPRETSLGWQALRSQHQKETAGRGEYQRMLSFEAIRGPLEDYACEVHEQEYYYLSESFFVWMRDEALALGYDDIYETQSENVRIAQAAQSEEAMGGYEEEEESKFSFGWLGLIVAFFLIRALIRTDGCGQQGYDHIELDPAIHDTLFRDFGNSYYPPDFSIPAPELADETTLESDSE